MRLSPALIALAVVLYLIVDIYAQRAAERSFDNLLTASALSIADAVQNETGGVTVEIPYASHALLAYRMTGRVFYRVSAPDGTLVTGYGGLASAMGPAVSATPRFANDSFLDAQIRAVTLGRFVSGGTTSGWVTVVVAQSNEDRERFAAELLRYAFGPTLAMTALAAGLIWLAVRQSLKPLDDIESAIVKSDPNSLKTLDVPVPSEIYHLVGALNGLMIRIKGLLMHMQDFIADSAHQIRSPLANLRSQLDMAQHEPDAEVARRHLANVHRNAVLVSHLANQLLADTMIVHRGEVVELVPLDLLELTETVTEEFADRTGAKINLTIGSLNEAPIITGDALMLREAISNILDNAVKYAGMAHPITVALELSPDKQNVMLSIADRGPGIPPSERVAALNRFFRGANAGESMGSGLGLSIVAKVVERHGGTIELADREGGGLAFIIRFQRNIDAAGDRP